MHSITFSARQVVKRYGGVTALTNGALSVASGEVLALMGANGSGKSTLSKIVTGVVVPDAGELLLDNKPIRFSSPQAARANGIAAVYQELSLVPELSVAENIWLGHEPRRWGRVQTGLVRERTDALLALFRGTVRPALRPESLVADLPPDERQIVEILKALSHNPRLLILDESTASLDGKQVERVFALVRQWQSEGRAIIFVSHRMHEVFALATTATVLRNGSTVATAPIGDTSPALLVNDMIGSASAEAPVRSAGVATGALRLQATHLRGRRLRDVSLAVRAGELLGLGGLQGQGQADLLLTLFGGLPYTGELQLNDQVVRLASPRQAMRAGVAFVPGDRNREGLLAGRSILDNFQLAGWQRSGPLVRLGLARRVSTAVATRLKLKMGGLELPVQTLSGGNAQKVVLGKWLLRSPALLLLNDPTKGVDVGAKADFYAILRELCAEGMAVILYSSDDNELLHVCDRVLVLHDGAISAELAGDQLNQAALVAASLGGGESTT